MIKIGVTENVIFSSAIKNDKGTLSIGFKELGTAIKEVKKKSFLEELNGASDDTETSGETTFLLFLPEMTNFETKQVEEGKVLLSKMMDFKSQLNHILLRYVTEKNIKWNILLGCVYNVNDENDILNKLQVEAFYKKVYDNIINQFIAQAKPHLNNESKPCRMSLIRQSAAKGYGTLRKKFLGSYPFLESMEIAKAQSKMFVHVNSKKTKSVYFTPDEDGYLPFFTDYEINRGLDNSIQTKVEADKPAAPAEADIAASELFGGAVETTDADLPDFGATEFIEGAA